MKQQLEGTSMVNYRRVVNLVHGVSAVVLQTVKVKGERTPEVSGVKFR